VTESEKKRSDASEALIALRKAMGKTQQTFAVEVLKTAIGTIARYESSDPPRGDVLLRLRDIAREQGLIGAADEFQRIWLQEVHKALGPDVRTILIAEDGGGLMVASLEHGDLVEAQEYLRQLSSNRRKRKETSR
jgi:transcriptional regulator with XRE-family HTH domain